MLRLGLMFFLLCLCALGVGFALVQLHVVIVGPCAGPGILAIFGSVLLTATLALVFTILGAGAKLIRRLRQSQ